MTPIIYKHFKGRYYLAIGSVEHSDHQQHVIYQDILNGKVYSRPETQWAEAVQIQDEVEGTRLVSRFKMIKFLPPLSPAGHTLVVHCKREPYQVYIGRPSKWGNPHKVGPMTREAAIEKYLDDLINDPFLITEHLHELQGKVLGCFCSPNACHGDVLARLANAYNFPTDPSRQQIFEDLRAPK